MKRIYLNTLVVAIVSFIWSSEYYLNQVDRFANVRPFVYRTLVPTLAHLIEFVGVPSGISLVIIMTLSGVGFYLALRKLALEFSDLTSWQELGLVVGVLVSMFLFGQYRHPYDMMTAFLFTLGFYYIYNVEVWKYLVVFTLACVNRETAFLLIPISIMSWHGGFLFYYMHKKIWVVWLASVGIFGITTYTIRQHFSSYPGFTLLIDPAGNIQQLASHPYEFILGIAFVSGLMAWMFRKPQPSFLKLSFAILAPILIVMWIVCGQWDEIRVMWEISPIVILLMVL